MSPELRVRLLLSAQRALLGKIGPSWRAVWVGLLDDVVHFHPVIDGDISEEDRDASSVVATEIIADFPEIGSTWSINEELWSWPIQAGSDLICVFERRDADGDRLTSKA